MTHRSRVCLFALALLSVAWVHSPAPAGAVELPPEWGIQPDAQDRIHPTLATQMLEAAPGARVPVIVLLAEQANLESIEADVQAVRLGRDGRHDFVMTRLKAVAAQTQSGVRSHTDAGVAAGEIANVRSFWLINALALEANVEAIGGMAARPDVQQIFFDGGLELEEPDEESPATATPGGSEIGLQVINAPALWAMGYTGAGSIVMNIDTGVDGDHDALSSRWAGNNGVDAVDAWFDPFVQSCTTPCDFGTHGTHTMGTMCGLEDATADTVGVAFGATWVAAATIDVGASPSTSYSLAAFEWAADPVSQGGNGTRGPADVVSCSWRDPWLSQSDECGPDGTYWGVIDAFEALGGAVVFSAGNSGPSAESITPPKNRATTPVNIWASGNIQAAQPGFPIRNSSSRGPSSCDGVSIKPAACAPGTSVRSAVPGGYGNKTGTSMASPHVGGSVALLMEAFPQLTGTEIKLALQATALDLGDPGPDNTYGHGLIDLAAAFDFLHGVTALKDDVRPAPPAAVQLEGAVPNPFNPTTSISYTLPGLARVSLTIYDVKGRVVARLVDDALQSAGEFTRTWDGRTLGGERAPSGLYAFKLLAIPELDGHAVVRHEKAVLLK